MGELNTKQRVSFLVAILLLATLFPILYATFTPTQSQTDADVKFLGYHFHKVSRDTWIRCIVYNITNPASVDETVKVSLSLPEKVSAQDLYKVEDSWNRTYRAKVVYDENEGLFQKQKAKLEFVATLGTNERRTFHIFTRTSIQIPIMSVRFVTPNNNNTTNQSKATTQSSSEASTIQITSTPQMRASAITGTGLIATSQPQRTREATYEEFSDFWNSIDRSEKEAITCKLQESGILQTASPITDPSGNAVSVLIARDSGDSIAGNERFYGTYIGDEGGLADGSVGNGILRIWQKISLPAGYPKYFISTWIYHSYAKGNPSKYAWWINIVQDSQYATPVLWSSDLGLPTADQWYSYGIFCTAYTTNNFIYVGVGRTGGNDGSGPDGHVFYSSHVPINTDESIWFMNPDGNFQQSGWYLDVRIFYFTTLSWIKASYSYTDPTSVTFTFDATKSGVNLAVMHVPRDWSLVSVSNPTSWFGNVRNDDDQGLGYYIESSYTSHTFTFTTNRLSAFLCADVVSVDELESGGTGDIVYMGSQSQYRTTTYSVSASDAVYFGCALYGSGTVNGQSFSHNYWKYYWFAGNSLTVTTSSSYYIDHVQKAVVNLSHNGDDSGGSLTSINIKGKVRDLDGLGDPVDAQARQVYLRLYEEATYKTQVTVTGDFSVSGVNIPYTHTQATYYIKPTDNGGAERGQISYTVHRIDVTSLQFLPSGLTDHTVWYLPNELGTVVVTARWNGGADITSAVTFDGSTGTYNLGTWVGGSKSFTTPDSYGTHTFTVKATHTTDTTYNYHITGQTATLTWYVSTIDVSSYNPFITTIDNLVVTYSGGLTGGLSLGAHRAWDYLVVQDSGRMLTGTYTTAQNNIRVNWVKCKSITDYGESFTVQTEVENTGTTTITTSLYAYFADAYSVYSALTKDQLKYVAQGSGATSLNGGQKVTLTLIFTVGGSFNIPKRYYPIMLVLWSDAWATNTFLRAESNPILLHPTLTGTVTQWNRQAEQLSGSHTISLTSPSWTVPSRNVLVTVAEDANRLVSRVDTYSDGFESGLTGWSTTGTPQQSNAASHSGTYSASITAGTSIYRAITASYKSMLVNTWVFVPISSLSGSYDVLMHIKLQTTGGTFYHIYYRLRSSYASQTNSSSTLVYNNPISTDTWIQLTKDIRQDWEKAGCTWVNPIEYTVEFLVAGTGTGTLYVDDVTLEYSHIPQLGILCHQLLVDTSTITLTGNQDSATITFKLRYENGTYVGGNVRAKISIKGILTGWIYGDSNNLFRYAIDLPNNDANVPIIFVVEAYDETLPTDCSSALNTYTKSASTSLAHVLTEIIDILVNPNDICRAHIRITGGPGIALVNLRAKILVNGKAYWSSYFNLAPNEVKDIYIDFDAPTSYGIFNIYQGVVDDSATVYINQTTPLSVTGMKIDQIVASPYDLANVEWAVTIFVHVVWAHNNTAIRNCQIALKGSAAQYAYTNATGWAAFQASESVIGTYSFEGYGISAPSDIISKAQNQTASITWTKIGLLVSPDDAFVNSGDEVTFTVYAYYLHNNSAVSNALININGTLVYTDTYGYAKIRLTKIDARIYKVIAHVVTSPKGVTAHDPVEINAVWTEITLSIIKIENTATNATIYIKATWKHNGTAIQNAHIYLPSFQLYATTNEQGVAAFTITFSETTFYGNIGIQPLSAPEGVTKGNNVTVKMRQLYISECDLSGTQREPIITLRLTYEDGTPATEIQVKIKIGEKEWTAKTDSRGYATFKPEIALAGKIKIQINGQYTGNDIIVDPDPAGTALNDDVSVAIIPQWISEIVLPYQSVDLPFNITSFSRYFTMVDFYINVTVGNTVLATWRAPSLKALENIHLTQTLLIALTSGDYKLKLTAFYKGSSPHIIGESILSIHIANLDMTFIDLQTETTILNTLTIRVRVLAEGRYEVVNMTVILNVNGKNYTSITDKHGIAIFNIPIEMEKALQLTAYGIAGNATVTVSPQVGVRVNPLPIYTFALALCLTIGTTTGSFFTLRNNARKRREELRKKVAELV